eukprot:scaffold67923_cov54-Phaeocystis_antarctica.AAC.1
MRAVGSATEVNLTLALTLTLTLTLTPTRARGRTMALAALALTLTLTSQVLVAASPASPLLFHLRPAEHGYPSRLQAWCA